MNLSLLRARIRAGGYQDDLHSITVNRLIFLRWLVQQGWVSEWSVADDEPSQPQRTSHATAGRHAAYRE